MFAAGRPQRVADVLGVPFLDRALPASPAASSVESERPSGLVGTLARASSMLAGEPVERIDLDEGHMRAELAECLARASTDGGVVLERGGVHGPFPPPSGSAFRRKIAPRACFGHAVEHPETSHGRCNGPLRRGGR